MRFKPLAALISFVSQGLRILTKPISLIEPLTPGLTFLAGTISLCLDCNLASRRNSLRQCTHRFFRCFIRAFLHTKRIPRGAGKPGKSGQGHQDFKKERTKQGEDSEDLPAMRKFQMNNSGKENLSPYPQIFTEKEKKKQKKKEKILRLLLLIKNLENHPPRHLSPNWHHSRSSLHR